MPSERKRAPVPFTALSALLLMAALFLFFQAQALHPSPLPGRSASPTPALSRPAVFFTRPGGSVFSAQAAGIEDALAVSLDAASLSIDVAVYHLDLAFVRDGLLRAHRRGVTVRVVTESDNLLEPTISAFEAAGIPVLGDRREGLMHHKFLVVDGRRVWTGSMNLTDGDLGWNDNNFLEWDSDALARDYHQEFEEMWADRFGPDSLADTPEPSLQIEGIPVEVYFSPDDGVAAHLVRFIQNAQRSVHFLAFSFTSDAIAEAMIERAAAGIDVRGVLDDGQASGAGSEDDRLRQAGIAARLDGNPGLMHHKVILVDGQAVWTGSYNFSRNAEETNDENAILIWDAQTAAGFEQEWQRVFDLALP